MNVKYLIKWSYFFKKCKSGLAKIIRGIIKVLCSVVIYATSYVIKSEEEKTAHIQKLAIEKNPQFLTNPHETW